MKPHAFSFSASRHTRRAWLRYALAGTVACLALPLGLPGMARASSAGPGSVLVVYYSWSGNTRALAASIRERTNGQLLELTPVQPYSSVYKEVTAQAKEELSRGHLPELQPVAVDVAAFDTVFVGSPNWWGTIAPPVMSFLAAHDFTGKNLVPFITHEGSRLGRSADDIRRLAPGAVVRDGLAVRGKNVRNAANDVDAWLRSLGMENLAR